MRPSVAPLLAAAVLLCGGPLASAQVQGDLIPAEECEIGCLNDSVCRHGSADYSGEPTNADGSEFFFHVDKTRDGQYCDCTEGFTGIRCGRAKRVCEAGHVCYHGGRCIPTGNLTISDSQFFCDCNDAKYAGVPYVGKFCEHSGATKCGDDSNNPDHHFFCVNGGTCKDDFQDKAHPCRCRDGYRGPHCEFQDGHVPACNLDCENGGQCFLGLKSYEQTLLNDYWLRHDGKFQYCSCPDGYFGPKCEIRGMQCGPSYCFNGGSCVETEGEAGTTVYNCDCTSAHTETESFGGRFCQAKSTSFCQKQNSVNNGHLFCTNGGTCDPLQPHADCECPEGFHGPICEFHHKNDTIAEPTCNLQCKNGGRCRHGAKEVGTLLQFGKELQAYTNRTHQDWEHCVCPEGFFGVECEHELEVCPGGEHVCLHGSKCVPENELDESETTHACNCEHGFDAFERHAGKFCQYSSTDICTRDRKQGTGRSAFNFCVNNGKCKDVVDHDTGHPGCECPDGFEGEHCEFLAGTQTQSSTGSGSSQSKKKGGGGGLIVTLVILCLAFVGLLGFIVLYRRRQASGKDVVMSNDTNLSPRIEETEAVEETTVIDGEKMQTVQIC